MKVTADTNVLVRAITEDDARQSRMAQDELTAADSIAIPLTTLCELVWVLSRGYRFPDADISAVIRRLVDTHNVAVNRQAVDVGLAMLEAGGDFADGIIAFEGKWLGADVFLSFDGKAVALLSERGQAGKLLR